MTIKIGEGIPEVTLQVMGESGPEGVTSGDFFSNKRVVLFALPGAFTPTCSARHLPGFIAAADDMKAKGVDAIACLSVNDAWVMDAWSKDQGVGDKIVMLADGSGHLTRALGLELDRTSGGMGMRSRRYAMVVDDGRVSQLNIEADGKFEVSDAQTMLSVL